MTPYEFRQSEPPTPRLWGHLGFILLLIAAFCACQRALGQAGDPKWFFRGIGIADQTGYTTKVNSTLYSINGSGNFALLAQSNFANASHTHTASAITDFNATGDARWSLLAHTHTFASLTSKPTTVAGYGITDFNTLGDARWALLSHTHLSAHITDASTGGNGASDAGKVVKFGAAGQLTASNDAIVGNAVVVTKTGVGGNGVSITIDNGNGINIQSDNGRGALIASIGEHDALYVQGDATTKPVIHAQSQDVTNAADLLHLHAQSNLGMEVRNNGGIAWTSATGAQTTATNLPAFGTATKGVVPASGGGTTNFLRADGTWNAPAGGSGTVTSVSVTTANGVSGSVANATTTPAITLTLGAITPTSVAASGAVSGSNLSGTNTGDQDLSSYATTAAVSAGYQPLDADLTSYANAADAAARRALIGAGTGSGTVTSVAVSGTDGIDIDSGSPITGSGTIQLGVNASTLKTHLSLNNVENTALSTWGGSTNINTLGALPSVKINAAARNLIIAAGSTYASDRTLTLFTDDTNRSLTLGGNTTLNGGTHSGTNTGDQTSIVGITGSLAEFNTALTGADFATGGGTATGTNTGDQTITLTGDITGSGTGSFAATIASGVIVNADINASAAIALSKLATDPLARANHTGTQAVSTISDATTAGQNLVKLTNPSAISYARINADNTVTARTPAQTRSDLHLHPVTITPITGGSQASTSTGLADVTGSTMTFADTGWYEFEYFIVHSAGATTTGAFYAVNTDGTMAMDYLTLCTAYDVLATDKSMLCANGFNSNISSSSSRGTTAVNRSLMSGTIHVTTAGGMLLRFATEVGASAITITDLQGWYRNL